MVGTKANVNYVMNNLHCSRWTIGQKNERVAVAEPLDVGCKENMEELWSLGCL